MNAYTRIHKDKLWKVEKDGERLEEDGIEVASFIKTSASVTNIHGSILLKPSKHDFYKMLLPNHFTQFQFNIEKN